MIVVVCELHPLLDLRAFVTHFPRPLSEMSPLPPDFLSTRTAAMSSDDRVRSAIRTLLRHSGFRPTGRNRPASEYLIKAVAEGLLARINVAVDVCNFVSLHSGLPISVVDLDRTREPLRVCVAPAGAEYVFNSAGQSLDLEGLLCLCDADGPCATAVKDSQRTKTGPATRRTVSLLWGTAALPGRTDEAERWYRALLDQHGAATEPVLILQP